MLDRLATDADTSHMDKTMAELLKAFRAKRQWSQVYLAVQLGVPIDTYRKWEQGRTKPPSWVADKLADMAVQED